MRRLRWARHRPWAALSSGSTRHHLGTRSIFRARRGMIAAASMRYLILCVSVLALCAPGPAAAGTVVSAFYYPWFGTTADDGDFAHWAQGGHAPPMDIASNYYPSLGVYSSSSMTTLTTQMADIAAPGSTSSRSRGGGRGRRRTGVSRRCSQPPRQQGIAVAAHLEPYTGRTVASTLADIVVPRGLRRAHVLPLPALRPAAGRLGGRERPAAPARARGVGADGARRRCRKGTFHAASTPTTRWSTAAGCSRGSAARRTPAGYSARRRSGPATTPGARPATSA